jgi:hypothetical protein
MDTLTPQQRSERMSRVRSKDTKPEMIIRRLVHHMGFRYRLHVRDLPGRPDLVFRFFSTNARAHHTANGKPSLSTISDSLKPSTRVIGFFPSSLASLIAAFEKWLDDRSLIN